MRRSIIGRALVPGGRCAGAVVGALAVGYLPRQAFDLVFGVVLLAVALFLFFRPAKVGDPAARGGRSFSGWLSRPTALATRTRSRCHRMAPQFRRRDGVEPARVGGGIIHVPAMVLLLNFPVHVATATSHFILAGMALVGRWCTRGRVAVVRACGRRLRWRWGGDRGAAGGAAVEPRPWAMDHAGTAVALGLVGMRILVLGLGDRPHGREDA
jgi:hypothetical protein